MGYQIGRKQADEAQLMPPGIGEGRQHLPWTAAEQEAAALHGETGKAARALPQDDRRPRHHACAEEIARIALDQDDAAALAVRRPLPRIAPDENEPAGHAAPLAGQPAAEPVAGIAGDLDDAAGHGCPGEGPGMATDGEASAAHGK